MSRTQSGAKAPVKAIQRKDDTLMRHVNIDVEGSNIQIPISEGIYSRFCEQFPQNTENQEKRYATLMNLLRAAYLLGLRHGRKQQKELTGP